MRAKYCVPLRTALALKLPLSIKGRVQGIAAAPTAIVVWPTGQTPVAGKKNCWAVCKRVTPFRFDGGKFDIKPVPTVFGKFVCAKATNAGSANVWLPAIVEFAERKGSTSKKKKNW